MNLLGWTAEIQRSLRELSNYLYDNLEMEAVVASWALFIGALLEWGAVSIQAEVALGAAIGGGGAMLLMIASRKSEQPRRYHRRFEEPRPVSMASVVTELNSQGAEIRRQRDELVDLRATIASRRKRRA